MRPTLLGNAVARAETGTVETHQFDYRRLGAALSEVVGATRRDPTAGPRTEINLLTSLSGSLAVATVIALFAFRSEPNLAIGVAAALLLGFWTSYRGAIRSADSYRRAIMIAVELYRFDLVTALRLPLPRTDLEEPATFTLMARLFDRRHKNMRITYDHQDPADATPDDS